MSRVQGLHVRRSTHALGALLPVTLSCVESRVANSVAMYL